MRKITSVLEYSLPIRIAKQKEGGYVITCPTWSDCYAQGETVDEAILEITAVAQSLIELYKEEGKAIPLKKTTSKSSRSLPIIVAA